MVKLYRFRSNYSRSRATLTRFDQPWPVQTVMEAREKEIRLNGIYYIRSALIKRDN